MRFVVRLPQTPTNGFNAQAAVTGAVVRSGQAASNEARMQRRQMPSSRRHHTQVEALQWDQHSWAFSYEKPPSPS
jgi:hypothetical protein